MLKWENHEQLYHKYKNYHTITTVDDIEILQKQQKHAIIYGHLAIQYHKIVIETYKDIIKHSIELGTNHDILDYFDCLLTFNDKLYKDVAYFYNQQEKLAEKLFYIKKTLQCIPNFHEAKQKMNKIDEE